jgi:hypothetical protein
MTDPIQLPRLYDEKEIGRILKRATELQHAEPSAPGAGVTLAELEEIAAEAGIDPRYLRRAALEVEGGRTDASVWARVAGDDLMLVRDLTLQGELDEDGFERIVAAIQTGAREHGHPILLGRTLTWRAETPTKTRTMQIVVTSRDGQTRIRLEEDLTQTAVGWMAGLTAGGGVGVGMGVGMPIALEVLGSTLFAFAFPVGTVALSYIAARQVYRAIVERRRTTLGRLFDAIAEEARAAIASAERRSSPPPDSLPAGDT